jgi:hypothetical protein
VVVLLYSVGAMAQVIGVRPVGFWGLWCPFEVEVVARRDDYAVDVVVEGFGYAVEMEVVWVADEGSGCAVEPRTLAGDGCPGCTTSL